VGAGSPAMALCQATSMLQVLASSLASQRWRWVSQYQS
jgi:hypothetical protein